MTGPYIPLTELGLVPAIAGRLGKETDNWAASRGLPVSKGNLGKLSQGLTRVRGRAGRAVWGIVGDSLSSPGFGGGVDQGTGSGTNVATSGNATKVKSWTTQMLPLLANAGIPARADGFIGTGYISAYSNADAILENPYITALGAGWSAPAGGRLFTNTTDTTSLTFSPAVAADGFDIIYLQNTGYATFTVTDADGTIATINAAGTATIIKQTVMRATASTKPISIQRNGTGANLILMGVLPFNSQNPMLELVGMGIGGAKASDWLLEPLASSSLKTIAALAPDFYTIQLGANDIAASVTAATFKANMQQLITACAATGASVGIVKSGKATSNLNPSDLTPAYLTAMDELARENSMALNIDFNSIPVVTTDRFDGLHPSGSGYAKQSAVAVPAFLAVA